MKPTHQSWLYLSKYSILKRNAKEYFRELLANQVLSPTELDELCWNRTKDILSYAYQYVPYYRRRFDEIGLDPRDVAKPEDYQQVPLLTREDLREHFDSMLSSRVSRRHVKLSTTGGSTGQPVKVLHQNNVVRAAAGWRMQSWWGLLPGSDMASIYRDTRTSLGSRIAVGLLWWPSKRILLNAANLSDSEIERFVAEYCRHSPPLIHGYVNALSYVASWLEERKYKVPPPKAVWATSAPLTSVQKERIERAFRAPVYDQYGCCEIYWLAAQCPEQDGLHMFTDIRRFEILEGGGNPVPTGESGQIAVTDLENYYFPLIRYLNGDKGRVRNTPCTCGISLPVMDQVKGRVSDNLLMPDGTQVSGEFMTTVFDDVPELVKQFKIRQRKDYSVVVDVVPDTTFPDYELALEKVQTELAQSMGGKLPVVVRMTDEIPMPRGKIKFIESEFSAPSADG
jgi:phenylacetate-CoA ligase